MVSASDPRVTITGADVAGEVVDDVALVDPDDTAAALDRRPDGPGPHRGRARSGRRR